MMDRPSAARKPLKPTVTPPLTVAEFFCGIGLVRAGLESEGWTVLYCNDHSPIKRTLYEQHYRDKTAHFDSRDVRDVKGADIPRVQLATASFPCTDLSLAGGKRGFDGKHSSTFWEFARILDEMGDRRPPVVLIENVTGFIHSKAGNDFRDSLTKLNDLGYLVDPFILNASHFVPQSRPRLFVIGIQRDLTPAIDAKIENAEDPLRPPLLSKFIEKHRKIDWTMRQLPKVKDTRVSLKRLVGRGNHKWWTEERTEKLVEQMSRRSLEHMQARIGQKPLTYGTVFRRMRNDKSTAELRVDGLAGCLRTPKGGSAKQILFVMGNNGYKARHLTARECAKLMGAKKFNLRCSENDGLFAFGDGVCVPAISWIARNYLNVIAANLIIAQKKSASPTKGDADQKSKAA